MYDMFNIQHSYYIYYGVASPAAAPPVSVPHRSAAHASPHLHLNPNQLLLGILQIPQNFQ